MPNSLAAVRSTAMQVTSVLLTFPLVAGHGSIVHPPPRNNFDSDLEPWKSSVPVSSDGVVPFVCNARSNLRFHVRVIR